MQFPGTLSTGVPWQITPCWHWPLIALGRHSHAGENPALSDALRSGFPIMASGMTQRHCAKDSRINHLSRYRFRRRDDVGRTFGSQVEHDELYRISTVVFAIVQGVDHFNDGIPGAVAHTLAAFHLNG